MNSNRYSTLFTAGLQNFNVGPSWTQPRPSPPPARQLVDRDKTPTPLSINVGSESKRSNPVPPSPTHGGVPQSPRRPRRRSSASIGSSPMASIKSPVQRAATAQRRAMVSPGLSGFGNGMWTLQEQQTLSRPRRGNVPPSRKPPPTGPLPSLPGVNSLPDIVPYTYSEKIPGPSPTLLNFTSRPRDQITLVRPPNSHCLLAPSPAIPSSDNRHLTVASTPVNLHSSPLLGACDEISENGENDMKLW